jgi:diadenosine tetraphosphate (Ap4A) HIT family hydrolase
MAGEQMNETIRKFGYPATLIREYAHWLVLLRPAQPTLGSLVLAAKSDVTAFSALKPDAFAELSTVTAHIEMALMQAVHYQRINYLMLMMVDPHVHFHVIPRYEGERSAEGVSVEDAGWPKPPQLGEARALDTREIEKLVGWIGVVWQ